MTIGFKVYSTIPMHTQLFRALIRQAPRHCGDALESSYIRDSIRDPSHRVYVMYDKKKLISGKFRYSILGFATAKESPRDIYIDVICSKSRKGAFILNSIIHHRKPLRLGSVVDRKTLGWYNRAGFVPAGLVENGLIPFHRSPGGKLRPRSGLRSWKPKIKRPYTLRK